MQEVNRKVTFRLYPTRRQAAALEDMRVLHQRLYNACLEQRIMAYRMQRTTVTFAQQCREVTLLRAEFPDYEALNAQSLQVTLKRIDRAYAVFFRRVRQGQARPGFPRFKSLKRYSGWGYKTHGDGWKLFAGENMRHGALRLSGVGHIKMRGQARTPGVPVTLEVVHKQGRWYASVTVACTPQRQSGTKFLGYDWGVSDYATLVDLEEKVERIANPRLLAHATPALARAQQELARKQKGSRGWKRACKKVACVSGKVARQRHNLLHQTSARIVKEAAVICTEKLGVRAMIHSARGTLDNPGKNVAQKAGLNRAILDTAPAALTRMTRCKAEEAGARWIDVPTRKVKPSQTCCKCWRRAKKNLSERMHVCPCGWMCDRDEASARVQLCWGYKFLTGREPAWCGPMNGLPFVGPAKLHVKSR